MARLETERLVLRAWRPEDRAPFAALNADPEVMRYFQSTFSRELSDAAVDRIIDHFDRHGFGWWAVEIRDGSSFAGMVGLQLPGFDAHFTPCVEIGWRLAREHWGRAYAPEAAQAALAFGFGKADLREIVSFTTTANTPSRRVMEKIGMRRDPDEDFDHPRIPEGSPQRRHVLYRLDRDHWRDLQ